MNLRFNPSYENIDLYRRAIIAECISRNSIISNEYKSYANVSSASDSVKAKNDNAEPTVNQAKFLKPVCKLFETAEGCPYGKSCKDYHPRLKPSDRRCFGCGSTQHRKENCPKQAKKPKNPETGAADVLAALRSLQANLDKLSTEVQQLKSNKNVKFNPKPKND